MSKLFLFICLFLSACAANSNSGLENIQSQLVEIHSQNLISHQALMDINTRLQALENKFNLIEDKNLPAGKIITPNKANIVNPTVYSPKPSTPTSPSININTPTSPKVSTPLTNPQTPVTTVVPTAEPINPASPSTTVAPNPAPPEPAKIEAPKASSLNAEQAAYSMALKLYQAGRYEEAEAAFRAFEASFPQSSLLPNSFYWRGETLYARRMFAEAILVFKEVQALFPTHDKSADSLLKTALAYDRMADTENAVMHYNVLAEDWPNSDALKRARKLKLIP